ncbi:helix-turn-helix transcriptional regulator [Anaerococcus sp. AGMB09787]|uniref:helix-turn-helix transcriptional regulator n=1 Tax=Anaerococcus sp. AGMB09787 TaxID=2922869 RepID=UPI001FAF2C79|nr:helix-turn-helix transcriptional regulator [Anaerococcus sp. AGMB09787]
MGNNIKTIRKQKNMTQNDLAKAVGVTRQYIGDIENLKKMPTIKVAFDCAKALDVEVKDLFYYL